MAIGICPRCGESVRSGDKHTCKEENVKEYQKALKEFYGADYNDFVL